MRKQRNLMLLALPAGASTTAKRFHYTAASRLSDVFPLTPALSPVERGNRPQPVGESEMVGTFERRALGLPLPKGEGRGEGEQDARPKPTPDVSKPNCRATSWLAGISSFP